MPSKDPEKRKEASKRWTQKNKEHVNKKQNEWYHNNKHVWREYMKKKLTDDPEYHKWYKIKLQYKLTKEEWHDLLEKQNGKCAICLRVFEKYVVDHDHACCLFDTPGGSRKTCGDCIRGLLCHNCNKALGFINDDIEVLKRMISYLQKPYYIKNEIQ